ncbi:MAG TPA: NAD+ synthase, partial [Prolixibacteraceae bacterium]|nr:NAD+ synthase [Prolixibacteraceae bacterium]
MKIAIAQLNYHVGNFQENTTKIIRHIGMAREKNADLVVFSELSVCGYPPNDLLERKEFLDWTQDAVDQIVSQSKGIAVIIGAPTINTSQKGKKLHNSAIFINDGKIEKIVHKTLLPTYDIFDEYRHFEPNQEFEIIHFGESKIALTVCEDLWDDQPTSNSFAKSKLYMTSPLEELSQLSPDLVINIAASPFSYNQEGDRKKIMLRNAKEYNLPIIYANQVGAQTELIFDGGSMYINPQGEVEQELAYFEEDFSVIDLSEKQEIRLQPHCSAIEKIYNALVLGIRDYFRKTGFKTATLGLSGGIDSALVAVLATEALGAENIFALLMPSQYSSDHSITDALDLAENLGIRYEILSIQDAVDSFERTLSPLFVGFPPDVTEENIQARTRGILVMALSNKFGNILLNTTNKSECAVGYGTLYGDMNGGLSVLGDVYKTDVFKLARYINRD